MTDEQLFDEILLEIRSKNNFDKAKNHMQHGKTSVYDHSIRVARSTLKVANKLGVTKHKRELIRGALLHDYFLYDWHEKDNGIHDLHGFRHPYFALKNAERDFELTRRERNIILRHMFPLVPFPPQCKEAWLVCMVDKAVSWDETIHRNQKMD